MPQFKSVSSLINISTSAVSELVVRVCIASKSCDLTKILKRRYLRSNSAFFNFDESFSSASLPNSVSHQVLELSLEKWYDKKYKVRGICEFEEMTVYYLIHKICDGCVPMWQFKIPSCHKEFLEFFTAYHKNIIHLQIFPCQKLFTLLSNMTNLTNLEITDFRINYNEFMKITNSEREHAVKDILPVIGRSCHVLKILKVNLSEHTTPDSEIAFKFCFKNYPLISVKNPICSTLKILNLMNTEIDEPFTDIIIENIPGLKSFGAYQAGYLLKNPSRVIFPPNNLEHFDTCLRYSDDEIRQDIAIVFPKLNSLSFNFEWRYFRRSVAKVNLHWLYKEVELSSWVKYLINLKLNYFPRQFLNFSILAVNCPKLKSLSLAHVFHGTKDPDSYDGNNSENGGETVEQFEFQELENLEVIIYEKINDDQPFFEILKLAHKTIQNLKFRIYEREYFSVLYLISTFFKLQFPYLKRLWIDIPHRQDCLSETAIMDFIEHCPQLTEYGFIPDKDLLKNLRDECARRNFCIKIFEKDDY